eukprot:ctg_1327.g436
MASRKPHEGVAWFIPAAEREALQLVLDVLRDLLDGRRLPSRQDDGEDSGAVRSGQHYLSFMRLLEQLLRQLGDAHGVALPRSLVPVLAAGMEGRLPPSVTDQMAVDRREQDEQDEPTVPVAAALHLERDAPVSLPLAQELQLVALRVMRRCLCSYTFQPTHLDLLQLLRAVLLPRRAFAAADPETRWHGERSAGVDALCTRWAAHKELLAADAQRVHELFGGADGLFVALAALQPRDASVDRVLRSVVDRLYEAAGAASSRTEGETGRSLAALLWEMLGLGPAASNRERPPGNGELSAPDQRNPHPPRGAANAAAAAAAAAISTAFILGAERLAPPELLTAEETGTSGAVALKRPRRAVDAAAEPRDRASMRAFLVACLDSMTAMPPLSTDAETALWETVLRLRIGCECIRGWMPLLPTRKGAGDGECVAGVPHESAARGVRGARGCHPGEVFVWHRGERCARMVAMACRLRSGSGAGRVHASAGRSGAHAPNRRAIRDGRECSRASEHRGREAVVAAAGVVCGESAERVCRQRGEAPGVGGRVVATTRTAVARAGGRHCRRRRVPSALALTAFVTSVGSSAPRPPPDIATIPDGVFEDALMARWHAVRAGCAHERTALDRLSLDERGSGEAGAGFTVAALRLADSNGDERVLRLAIQQAVRDAASRQLFLEDADVWDIAVRAEPKSNDDTEDTEVLCPVWHTADVLVRCAAVADTTALCSRPVVPPGRHAGDAAPGLAGGPQTGALSGLIFRCHRGGAAGGDGDVGRGGVGALLASLSRLGAAGGAAGGPGIADDDVAAMDAGASRVALSTSSTAIRSGIGHLRGRRGGTSARWAACRAAVRAAFSPAVVAARWETRPAGCHLQERHPLLPAAFAVCVGEHVCGGGRATGRAMRHHAVARLRGSAAASLTASDTGRRPHAGIADGSVDSQSQRAGHAAGTKVDRVHGVVGAVLDGARDMAVAGGGAGACIRIHNPLRAAGAAVFRGDRGRGRCSGQDPRQRLGGGAPGGAATDALAPRHRLGAAAVPTCGRDDRNDAQRRRRRRQQQRRRGGHRVDTRRSRAVSVGGGAAATGGAAAAAASGTVGAATDRCGRAHPAYNRASVLPTHRRRRPVGHGVQSRAGGWHRGTLPSAVGAGAPPHCALSGPSGGASADVRPVAQSRGDTAASGAPAAARLRAVDRQVRQRVAALADAPPEVVAVRGRAERCLRFILFELYALGDEAQAEYAVAVLGGPWKALARQLHRDYLRFHQYSGIA